MKFISQRCVNVNRGESDEKRPKREVNKGKHLHLDDVQSIVVDDEVSFDRNIKKLSAEAQKSNPNTEVLNSKHSQTDVCLYLMARFQF